MSICRLHQVRKAYRTDFLRRRIPVLKGVSFELEPGEAFAYLGHNGAGKTTTIKTLLGLIRPDGGEVEIFGAPPGDVKGLARLGYLPENPWFYDHLTGRELLLLVAQLHGLKGAAARRRCGEVLELVDMESRADRRLKSCSKGMLQRIGLAQALVNDPELLILDEPMGGLDPVGRHQIRGILAELKSRGKTLFLSSHILADVESLADRAAILQDGVLRRVVRMSELVEDGACLQVQVRGLDPVMAEALEREGHAVRVRGEICHLQADDETALPSLLSRIQAGGGRVLRVEPLRSSLEDVFLKEIGHAPSARPQGADRARVERMVQEVQR